MFSLDVLVLSVYAVLLLNIYGVRIWVASSFVNQKTKSVHFKNTAFVGFDPRSTEKLQNKTFHKLHNFFGWWGGEVGRH